MASDLRPTRVGLPWSDCDVAEGRRLVTDLDRSKFALGDLAIRVAGPSPGRGQRDGSYALLAQFAEAIGVSGESLSSYRAVSTAWPDETRIEGATWTLHRALVNREHRLDELADFIAAARRDGFVPTRTALVKRLREASSDKLDEADPFYWTKLIARAKAAWVSRSTGDLLPWTLARRRDIALLVVLETAMSGLGEAGARLDGILTADESLMADVLAAADVLPPMRDAFATYVARVDGPDVADSVVDPGRLPDVEALAVVWRAMLAWSSTREGSDGWLHIASSLFRRFDDLKGSNPLAALKAWHMSVLATMLTGDEDLMEGATAALDELSAAIAAHKTDPGRFEPAMAGEDGA